jgi:hypothetical protein
MLLPENNQQAIFPGKVLLQAYLAMREIITCQSQDFLTQSFFDLEQAASRRIQL